MSAIKLIGEKRPPYRPQCGDWPAKRFRGDCFQHYRRDDSAIPKHVNVTLTKDCFSPPGPNRVPYPRLISTGLPSCANAPTCTCTGPGADTCNNWPAADRPGGANGVACHAPDATHETISLNCFQADNGVANLARCRKMGFKNVQAIKCWHGRFGFMNGDGVTEPIGTSPIFDILGCTCSPFEPERPTADGTKYRTLQVKEEHKLTGHTDHSLDNDQISIRKTSIDRYSGEETMLSYSDSHSGSTTPAYGDLGNSHYTPLEPLGLQDIIAGFYAILTADVALASEVSGSIGEWTFDRDTRDGDGNGLLIHAALSVSTGHTDNRAREYGIVDGSNGVLKVDTYSQTDLTNTNSTNYSYVEAFHTTTPIPLPDAKNEHWLIGDLSDGYTSANVQSDLTTLLAQWNLSNDRAYPWRTDLFVTVAPLCSYDENTASVPHPRPGTIFNNIHNPDYPGTADGDYTTDGGLTFHWIPDHQSIWTAEGYVDGGVAGGSGAANPPIYSGAAKGGPLPAGYDKFFDWTHLTYRCCLDDLMIPQFYAYAVGAFSGQNNAGDRTDGFIPGTATQWTQNHTGGNVALGADALCPGAWIIGNSGFMMAQKWAEIKNPRPSYNFFGPCGKDRFRYSENLVGCVSTYDAGTKTVTLIHAVAGMTSGVGLICGIDANTDGVWNFTRTSDTVYVLTGSRLRTSPARSDCSNATFGKLLFPSAWPICGRVSVTSATASAGVVTVTCGAAPYLRTGDVVDFTDASGTVTESNKTVTVISETQFTFSGSVPAGTYVISHSAPAYWWYDNRPKWSYLLATWTHNYRDYQERKRVNDQWGTCDKCDAALPADSDLIRENQLAHGMPQSVAEFTVNRYCLPWTPCAPQVMCSSPNGETWENGATYGWPAVGMDGRYGSGWQALFIQEINDFLYQSITSDPEIENTYSDPTTWPHMPCNLQVNNNDPDNPHMYWNEDQGGCTPDDATHFYFPFRPVIEPEIVLPVVNGVTAPALPTGFYIGFLSLAELDTSGDVNGNILVPPAPVGSNNDTNATPTQYQTPWGLYVVMMGCVCADMPGRFHVEYENYLTLCPPAS